MGDVVGGCVGERVVGLSVGDVVGEDVGFFECKKSFKRGIETEICQYLGVQKKTTIYIVLFFLLHLQELARMLVRVLVPK